MSVVLAGLAAALLAGRDDDALAVLVLPPGAGAGRALGAAIGSGRVFAHTVWETPDSAPAVTHALHVELADADEDVVEPHRGLWPGGVLQTRRRRRRLDTLHGDDPRPVGVIVLCHPGEPGRVLAGAARVLQRDRPDLLIDLRDLALPDRRRVVAAVAERLGSVGLREVGGGLFARIATGRRLPRPVAAAVAVTAFDDRLACGGLHPPEFDAPAGGRWSGLGHATWFVLPRPPAGDWLLRLGVADWGNAGTGCAALIDDAWVSPRVEPESLCYGPIAIAPGGEVIRVRLLLPRPVADLVRWPRRIGLRLLSAAWERAG